MASLNFTVPNQITQPPRAETLAKVRGPKLSLAGFRALPNRSNSVVLNVALLGPELRTGAAAATSGERQSSTGS
jgi:hypothetical protein